MIRRKAIVLSCASLVAASFTAGCGSGTVATAPVSASNEPSYGENKLPPPDQVAPKKGQGRASPGGPPSRDEPRPGRDSAGRLSLPPEVPRSSRRDTSPSMLADPAFLANREGPDRRSDCMSTEGP